MKLICAKCKKELQVENIYHFGTDLTVSFQPCSCTDIKTYDCDFKDQCQTISDIKINYQQQFEKLVYTYDDLGKALEEMKRKYSNDEEE
jgi:hypothetical protein